MDRAMLLRNVRWGPGGPVRDVRVRDGRVAAIGEPGARADGEPVADGRGGTLLPGLVDAHAHLGQWAEHRRRVPLEAADSAAAAAALMAAAERRPELLLGAGFRDALWPDAPHKDLLEAAAPGVPMALLSNDLHTVWLSPAALRLLGRDHATGVFTEAECFAVTAGLPSAGEAERDAWVLEAVQAAAERGVTRIADYEMADTAAEWLRRSGDRRPPTRISCIVARHLLDRVIGRGHRTGTVLDDGGLLTVGPLKLFADGSLNTRTAACDDPYPGSCGAGAHGLLELPFDELVPLMERAAEHGLAPAVHAIGDRANRVALDAFAKVGCRGRIEHAQLLAPGEAERFARLGVVAGVQPAHAPDDRDVAEQLWSGRTGRAFPYADLLAAGARLEFGSDAPVAPLDPWDGIAAAVARTDDERPPWHPEQAVSLGAALAASADGRTAVREGDAADFTVTADDPAVLAPADLRAVPVLLTAVDGRPTAGPLSAALCGG
ncbi:amidohydrolase [Nocardiopsis coralliicola]